MGRSTIMSCLAAASAVVAIGGLTPAAQAQTEPEVSLTRQTLALSGETAPGTSFVYRSFQAPVLNAGGRVAFYGFFGGPEAPTEEWTAGIWTGMPNAFELAARVGGDAPPIDDGLQFTGFGGARVGMADTGDLVFNAVINSGNTENDRGIFTGTINAGVSTLQRLAREDDPAPGGTAGQNFDNDLGVTMIGPSGIAGFSSPLENDPANGINEASLFAGTPFGLRALALAGTQVPGESANTLYAGGATGPRINSAGQSAFAAGLKGSGVSGTPTAIFFRTADTSSDNGVLGTVAVEGRDAPDTSADFLAVQHPDLNDSGQVAFVAGLNGFGGDDLNRLKGEAIYFGSPGSINAIAITSQALTGEDGVQFLEFASAFGPTINDGGEVVFLARLTGANVSANDDFALVAGAPGDLKIIAREGEGLPTGLNFTHMADSPILGDGGHVAFELTDPTTGALTLWMADLDGNLIRVVGEGDTFAVSETDSRLVETLNIGTSTDGYRFLTDDGTVAYSLRFDGGSEGVFSSTMMIPEPASAAVLAAGAMGLLLRRRRRRA